MRKFCLSVVLKSCYLWAPETNLIYLFIAVSLFLPQNQEKHLRQLLIKANKKNSEQEDVIVRPAHTPIIEEQTINTEQEWRRRNRMKKTVNRERFEKTTGNSNRSQRVRWRFGQQRRLCWPRWPPTASPAEFQRLHIYQDSIKCECSCVY